MRFEIGQSLEPAGGVRCRRAQKLGEFVRGPRRKTAVRSAGEASNLAERLFANWIVTLLKHKRLHVAQTKLSGAGAYLIERFLHRVTNKHQDGDLTAVVFAS